MRLSRRGEGEGVEHREGAGVIKGGFRVGLEAGKRDNQAVLALKSANI